MLRITINNQPIDLSTDISVSLNFENPFFSEEKIPTPYALNFEVPKTERNLGVLGRLDRLTSKLDAFVARYDSEISFDGIKMVEGVVSVVEIKRSTIELTFDCAAFLDRFKNKLWQNDFGKISFGYGLRAEGANYNYINTNVPRLHYGSYWGRQMGLSAPDFIAVPLSIKDYQWIAPEEDTSGRPPSEGGYVNQYAGRINQYNQRGYMDKLIPAVRVGYLLSKIDPALEQVLNEAGLEQLMLVCNYHPSYQTTDRTPVWTVDKETLECYCNVSDFLPDVTTAEFVVEMLKLCGGSMYTVKRGVAVATNNEVIDGVAAVDWTGKIEQGYTLSSESGQLFRLSFEVDNNEKVSDDRTSFECFSTQNMVWSAFWSRTDTSVVRVTGVGQMFEVSRNSRLSDDQFAHFDFTLKEDYPFNAPEQESDVEEEFYEISCKAAPPRIVVVTEILRDNEQAPSFTAMGRSTWLYYHAVEVEAPAKTRPTNLCVGLYLGLRNLMVSSSMVSSSIKAPYISANLFKDEAIRQSTYAKFSQWIGKRRRVLRGDVRLDALDLQRLDLRRKVYFGGCSFLIRELSVTLKYQSIELADATLVEC